MLLKLNWYQFKLDYKKIWDVKCNNHGNYKINSKMADIVPYQ